MPIGTTGFEIEGNFNVDVMPFYGNNRDKKVSYMAQIEYKFEYDNEEVTALPDTVVIKEINCCSESDESLYTIWNPEQVTLGREKDQINLKKLLDEFRKLYYDIRDEELNEFATEEANKLYGEQQAMRDDYETKILRENI